MLKKILHIFLLIVFYTTSVCPARGQGIVLPAPGAMILPSAPVDPVTLMGMKIYPRDPLHLDFIIDHGSLNKSNQGRIDRGALTTDDPKDTLKSESERLIRYFLASITIPENEMWVNLSPYEKNRIVALGLGETALGRDMLAQDYLLKQLTASLMHPDTELGAQFWKKVYALAQEKLGTTDPDMFNKVWIVPEDAEVLVRGERVFVTNARLKVMLEADYLADQRGIVTTKQLIPMPSATEGAQDLSKEVIREVLLPVIEQEVNTGTTFATLRQIYKAMILATWYKRHLKNSPLNKAYADDNKVEGLGAQNAVSVDPEAIWQQYVASFKKGVANLIREETDFATGDVIPRKYFTGGLVGIRGPINEAKSMPLDWAQNQSRREHSEVAVRLSMIDNSATTSPSAMSRQKRSLSFGSSYEEQQVENVKGILKSHGFGKGMSAVVVGPQIWHQFPLAVVGLGGHYLGFQINDGHAKDKHFDSRMKSVLDQYAVDQYGGSIQQFAGEFSSGKKSISRSLPNNSQDLVIIPTGALSDPRPESSAFEVLEEAVRVIKDGHDILVLTLGSGIGEYEKMYEVIQRFLKKRVNNGIHIEPYSMPDPDIKGLAALSALRVTKSEATLEASRRQVPGIAEKIRLQEKVESFMKGLMGSNTAVDQSMATPGGIDLNGRKLKITEDGTAQIFDMAQTDWLLRSGNFKGLHPIILGIRPVVDFPSLLR